MGLQPHFETWFANRSEIENEIERLIGLLDTIDPDPDLEPETDVCLAGDDGCGAHYRQGHRHWGAAEDALIPTIPIYGPDQSAGPLNEREGYRDWQRGLR